MNYSMPYILWCTSLRVDLVFCYEGFSNEKWIWYPQFCGPNLCNITVMISMLVPLLRPGEWSTFIGSSQTMIVPWQCQYQYGCWTKNMGKPPKIIHFNRVFPYKPSILRYHYFWKHPYLWLIMKTWGLVWQDPPNEFPNIADTCLLQFIAFFFLAKIDVTRKSPRVHVEDDGKNSCTFSLGESILA